MTPEFYRMVNQIGNVDQANVTPNLDRNILWELEPEHYFIAVRGPG